MCIIYNDVNVYINMYIYEQKDVMYLSYDLFSCSFHLNKKVNQTLNYQNLQTINFKLLILLTDIIFFYLLKHFI